MHKSQQKNTIVFLCEPLCFKVFFLFLELSAYISLKRLSLLLVRARRRAGVRASGLKIGSDSIIYHWVLVA